MFEYTTRFEVNVSQKITSVQDLNNFSTFIMKNRIPAVVIDPEFVDQMIIDRSQHAGDFKIIVATDFDTGKNFAMDKIKFLPGNAMNCDGLDIFLTPNRTEMESSNELKSITEFVRKLSPLMELRWIIGTHTRSPETVRHLKHFSKWPGTYIRNSQCCELPQRKMDHDADIALIRQYSPVPIKLSGNIDLATMKKYMNKVARFDVSLQQAKRIIKAYQDDLNKPKVEECHPEKSNSTIIPENESATPSIAAK